MCVNECYQGYVHAMACHVWTRSAHSAEEGEMRPFIWVCDGVMADRRAPSFAELFHVHANFLNSSKVKQNHVPVL